MDHRLLRHLRPVAARFRRVRLWTVWGTVWLVAAAAGLLLLWLRSRQALSLQAPPATDLSWAPTFLSALGPITPAWGWGLGVAALLSAAALAAWVLASFRDYHWIALQVESRFPTLRQRLLTSLAQRPAGGAGSYDYLQQTVIQETLSHAWKHPWPRTVPQRRIAAAQLFHLAALSLLVVVIVGLVRRQPPQANLAVASLQQASGDSLQLEVDPGDTEVEKGTGLIVAARFQGGVPRDIALTATFSDGQQQQLAMHRSLDDPVFGVHLPEVTADFAYQVNYDGRASREFHVTVFEYPALWRSDAVLSFPEYTQTPDKTIEDTRRVTAVEGSSLRWVCHLNKQVTKAELVDEDGNVLALRPSDEAPHAFAVSLTLTESRRWKLQLLDNAGRANKHPPELSVQVLPNRAPDLQLDLARDARVSPLEEFPVQASVRDDYGLTRFGLSYSLGGQPLQEIKLGEQTAGKETRRADYVLEFEKLQAEPDQLLSYHFWAEDVDAEGQPRRTYSDMFFAEVRHFEEIFREGEPPPGGQQQQQQQQGQAAQQAEQLAELQKQIINATWRIVRRETAAEVTRTFADDVRLLEGSQNQALEQLEELAGQVASGQSAELIQPIRTHMQQAARHLAEALEQSSVDPLHPALSEEQAAYQGMLKLRAREHEVQRGQPSSSSGSSGQSSARFQQQLQQLELNNEQNRYETQRQAQQAEDAQQREVRQTLSRLRELAQRQEDLNERLKELQLALEAAEDQQAREELERQLKRLRDQQEQLLRETDELLNRMDQSAQPETMEQARQDLEQNRENVRESAEALERGDVPQAVSSGTRAEREFERMRDEFRRQTANQFSEEVRELREQARQLDQRQQQLGEQLADNQTPDRGSLRASESRRQLAEQLQQQREDLGNILERMQETVQEAESAEPLLAQKLYDAFRETRQRRVENQLEAANELLQRGFDEQAAEQEQQARGGISQLRQNVEQAAESVLGDETEALERAVSELDRLSQQLNEEIQRSDPSESPQQPGQQQPGQQQPGQQQPGQQQPGQQQPGQQQPGQQQPGEQQPGQQQPGQQQPGERQPGQQQPGQQQPGQQQPGERQPAQPQRDGGGLAQWAGESLGSAPLTGGDFRDWSDRLRDVEEMIDDPQLRDQAARIRDRAQQIRMDFKRHSQEPQWSLVRRMVAEPLRELRREVAEELLRRTAERNEVVPIDRDPVPERFSEQVRRYYERLGSGR